MSVCRVLREQRRMTLEGLAAKAGVSLFAIRCLDKGRDASMQTLRKVSKALGVHPGVFFDPPGSLLNQSPQ